MKPCFFLFTAMALLGTTACVTPSQQLQTAEDTVATTPKSDNDQANEQRTDNAPVVTIQKSNVEQITQTKSVDTLMREERKAQKWQNGLNQKDGKVFFIAQGRATVNVDPQDAAFITARMVAFDKAMLNARSDMAGYISTKISSELSAIYQTGDIDALEATRSDDHATALEKLRAIVRTKVDNALKAEGVDVEKDAKDTVAAATKRILASDDFVKNIRLETEAFVTGLQAVFTCESSKTADGKVEIGVLALWSERLQQMAQSIYTGETVERVTAARSIDEQIPTDEKDLLSAFGVLQMVDEHGDLVLTAFAQAGSKSENALTAEGAREIAKSYASSLIRDFAGLNVAVTKRLALAESAQAYDDESMIFKDTSAMQRVIKQEAEALDFSGLAVQHTWSAPHPLNGRTVYGCVCTWSPKQAALAKSLKNRMAKPEKQKAEVAPKKPQPKAKKTFSGTAKEYSGRGLRANENAF